MSSDSQNVVFEEGDPKIAKRFAQLEGHTFHDDLNGLDNDRVVKFIIKMSGGIIKSRKVAVIIGLFLAAVMFAVSIIWFIKAIGGPKAP